jgi:hypothetical protein
MSQPVKVSNALVLDAHLMGEATQRSVAGQIEFWARLGRAIETVLRGDQVLALCKAGKARPLLACLKSMGSREGHKRLLDHLKTLPYPHFEPASDRPGLLVRIEFNGRRTLGRFVNRKFQPVRAGKH